MINKQKYKKFCKTETKIPIFMQPHWLDTICKNGMEWNVILYEKDDEIWGSFTYVTRKAYGFTMIIMPKLTQILGPYIKYPEDQKYQKKFLVD